MFRNCQQKVKERNERKAAAQERKKKQQERKLLDVVRVRHRVSKYPVFTLYCIKNGLDLHFSVAWRKIWNSEKWKLGQWSSPGCSWNAPPVRWATTSLTQPISHTPIFTFVLSLLCSSSGVSVSLVDGGVLCWPVYFVYPEFGESDFIEQFSETDKSVLSHLYIKTLRIMLGTEFTGSLLFHVLQPVRSHLSHVRRRKQSSRLGYTQHLRASKSRCKST